LPGLLTEYIFQTNYKFWTSFKQAICVCRKILILKRVKTGWVKVKLNIQQQLRSFNVRKTGLTLGFNFN